MAVPEYGAYFSITRVTYPLSIAWIIFACHFGYGGVINRFLSARGFIPLTRISYCAYLIHPVIMNAYFYTQEALFHGSGLTLVGFFFETSDFFDL
jgi:peptidoglycan/LPS O-acetylase OafA/YrhL